MSSPETVVTIVARAYNTTPEALRSPSRLPERVEARRIAMALLYERGRGYSAIGRALGRDHSTVMHSLRRHRERPTPEELEMYSDIRRELRQAAGARSRRISR